ncbi:MAG: hypothetical protein QOG41_1553, partial [Thermoleophilaceae bacterium]|nr:hypothetical protein [Thermoleophilaceae bacterium]
PEDVQNGLYDETLVGNAPRVLELTEEGLELGMEPQTLLFDALIPSLGKTRCPHWQRPASTLTTRPRRGSTFPQWDSQRKERR